MFRGDDGLDELTTTTTSQVWIVVDGLVRAEQFDPEQVGISRSQPGDLTGGDSQHNAAVAHAVLAGPPGPVREAVLLNAAAGLASLRLGQHPDQALEQLLCPCIEQARQAIDSGAAAHLLNRWVEFLR